MEGLSSVRGPACQRPLTANPDTPRRVDGQCRRLRLRNAVFFSVAAQIRTEHLTEGTCSVANATADYPNVAFSILADRINTPGFTGVVGEYPVVPACECPRCSYP